MAATIVIGIVGGLNFGPWSSGTLVAKAGEWREVRLPDGTQVRLAPQSHLEVHFTAHERDVLLTDGDGLFHVAKDPAKPFVVVSGRTRVRAVGTVFGVEHDSGAIVVTVEEGRVAVAETLRPLPAPPLDQIEPVLEPIPMTEISVGADQQIVVPAAGPISAIRKVDSRRELAWAEGRLIFDNESVGEVVRRFNRFNRLQLKIADPALANKPVTAVFDAADPEAFISFLESVADVRVTRASPNEILIASEGPR